MKTLKQKRTQMETIIKISKTKTILLFCFSICLIALTVSCFGQDTIVERNGQIILGKVLEISVKEVKYVKNEKSDGPFYIADKSTVSKIKYANGFVDSFAEIKPWMLPTPKVEEVKKVPVTKNYPELKKIGYNYWYGDKTLNEREMYDVLLYLKNPTISDHINTAKLYQHWQYIGFAAIPFGIASVYCFAFQNSGSHNSQQNRSYYGNQGKVWAVFALASFTTSITLKVKRKWHNAAAINLYQQNY